MSTNPTTDAGNIAGTPLTDARFEAGKKYELFAPFTRVLDMTDHARDLELRLTKSREATAQAERERDDTAAALQRLINAIGTFQLCGVGALRTVDDVVTAMSNVAGKLEAVNLRADLATARAERDGRETDLMIALKDLATETAKNAELRKSRDDYQEMARQSDAYIRKLAHLLGCTDGEDSPELGIKDLIADRAALRAKLAKLANAEKAMKSHERYLSTLKCWCCIANEAGDVDRCERCWALAEIDEAINGIEEALCGNDKAEKGAQP